MERLVQVTESDLFRLYIRSSSDMERVKKRLLSTIHKILYRYGEASRGNRGWTLCTVQYIKSSTNMKRLVHTRIQRLVSAVNRVLCWHGEVREVTNADLFCTQGPLLLW